MRPALLGTLLAACSLTPSSAAPQPPRDPAPVAEPDAGLSYVVRVTGGARADARLPLVIALHGLGDTPEAFVTLFEAMPTPARVIALRAPTPYYDGFTWFPPGEADRDPAAFGRAVEAVAVATQALARRFPTCGLPVVTGFSQGGMLSFALAARRPSVVRAAVPVAGRLPSGALPAARPVGGLLPEVVALHGTADARIAFAQGESAVRALTAAGFTAVLHPFAGVGHAIPPAVRADLFATLARMLRGGC